HGARVHHEPQEGAILRLRVLAHEVAQAVVELADVYFRRGRQRLVERRASGFREIVLRGEPRGGPDSRDGGERGDQKEGPHSIPASTQHWYALLLVLGLPNGSSWRHGCTGKYRGQCRAVPSAAKMRGPNVGSRPEQPGITASANRAPAQRT